MTYRRILIVLLFSICYVSSGISQSEEPSEKLDQLTVEKIMRDPRWIDSSPNGIYWSDDSKYIYFDWNPENAPDDSLYRVPVNGGEPEKVSIEDQKNLPSRWGDENRSFTKKVYQKNGDIFLLDIKKGITEQLTNTLERESDTRFSFDEKKIIFEKDDNLFFWHLEKKHVTQLTDFRSSSKKDDDKKPDSKQEQWLKQEQLKLFEVLKARKEKSDMQKEARKKFEPERPKEIYIGKQRVSNTQLSPDERFVTFNLSRRASGVKNTVVPNYVTESGFTEDLPTRSKTGTPQGIQKFMIYNIEKDSVFEVKTDHLPNIFDQPEFLEVETDTIAQETAKIHSDKEKQKPRPVYFYGPLWSDDGKKAVMALRSQDNKDYWIVQLFPETAKLKPLYHHHDEAWIGGPGVNFWRLEQMMGWMPDNRRIWFQSEESGFNHLYTLDISDGTKKQLTQGNYEIYSPHMSRDKKYWYFSANRTHPGERHFYRMNLDGIQLTQITTPTGHNRIYLSPDEKTLAVRYSYTNKPWELFIQKNKPGATMTQLTHSVSNEFQSYPWRDPKIVTFQASDSAEVYARLYQPKDDQANQKAVIFVHGAGYLQNAHKWWSSYFREYMFHNLLADRGYTVLDIDYRGSAGYGRDWRTAIYRHMGGKDLSDQVDGARFLVDNYGINPNRIGIYGGSYGGFITLMAMFTEPDVFAAGAALRPVTDWSHYSHWYTSNILNVPTADSLAYARSSPIYFAEGLKGALLICHGMIDRNVHFQDAVRLAQRLIELGKENWELAVYPLEGHSFRESSSWTDEYKRILKLFEENL